MTEEDVERTGVYVHDGKCHERLMKGRKEERKKKQEKKKLRRKKIKKQIEKLREEGKTGENEEVEGEEEWLEHDGGIGKWEEEEITLKGFGNLLKENENYNNEKRTEIGKEEMRNSGGLEVVLNEGMRKIRKKEEAAGGSEVAMEAEEVSPRNLEQKEGEEENDDGRDWTIVTKSGKNKMSKIERKQREEERKKEEELRKKQRREEEERERIKEMKRRQEVNRKKWEEAKQKKEETRILQAEKFRKLEEERRQKKIQEEKKREEEESRRREEEQRRKEEQERKDQQIREELRAIIEDEEERCKIIEEERKKNVLEERNRREEEERLRREQNEERMLLEEFEVRRRREERYWQEEEERRKRRRIETDEEVYLGGRDIPPPPPPKYFTRDDVFLLKEGRVATDAPEDEKEILPIIFREVVGSDEAKLEGDLRFLELRTEVWEKVEEATTRDEVWEIFSLMELKMEDYKGHIMGKCNKRLEELVKGKLISYGSHAGSYRGIKYAHRQLFGYYLAKFKKYREGWEFIRVLTIKGLASLLLMAERLMRIHKKLRN